jgi:hypothetical protein
VHVAEYVWPAAHTSRKPGTTEAEAWAADRLTMILAGQAAHTAADMTSQAEREHLPAARREAVDACHRYLTGHLDQLRYDTALGNGWPIATGTVEGTCRHLIADRLDSPAPAGAFTERKPYCGYVPSSPTETSTPTGATAPPANTSTPHPTSGATHPPSDPGAGAVWMQITVSLLRGQRSSNLSPARPRR